MSDEDEDFRTRRIGQWEMLPRWVKWITTLIGLPAWLVFVAGIFRGDIGSSYQMFALAIFAGVAALQAFFTVRALVRMDI
ncbi:MULTISPECIES: hypothetical protein [unclassified Sphingomonas]|jgi:hypothetical protein|uniref:hypothetical protein n=1 Tax=Sphingomonas TaxID=13687 RepID=UPI0009625599|nr:MULTISPECIES: hypothetical protein [unclassified Sphingomonas]MBN8811339.1 hypothetical protein [Sphingomonas sp.]OJY53202.1 MAG: hypothetical protein BGP17_10875 [Sphingomonas sp. 67-41]